MPLLDAQALVQRANAREERALHRSYEADALMLRRRGRACATTWALYVVTAARVELARARREASDARHALRKLEEDQRR